MYALTPPAELTNVGDHAQAVAIGAWLSKHFPGTPVVEIDKNESTRLRPVLRMFMSESDVIFLHSGGNLGDRGMWSETARRALIAGFPRNRIISLPQTIYFSDTERGRVERQRSAALYATHPHLTVLGRDPESAVLASQLFPRATTFAVPDFVLSLPLRSSGTRQSPPSVLLCLRLDNESLLVESEKRAIAAGLPYPVTRYDTTLPRPLDPRRREDEVLEALRLFERHDAVVTDRYHGLIFAVICGKPTVVLGTVDHKLSSAMDWFESMPQIAIADSIDEVPILLEEVLAVDHPVTIDWNGRYFDQLPSKLGLTRNTGSGGA